jgi:DNA-binding NarL/FixJ family response regulator
MENKIKVGIAEDQSMLRKRLIEHFRFFNEINVSIAAESGDAFLERLETMQSHHLPEVVLMDIEMPGLTGIESTSRIKERYPEIDIIMFTVFEDDERIFDAIQAGASGYLLKDEPIETIVQALKELKQGGAPMSSVIARKMLGIMRKSQVDSSIFGSPRKEIPFDLSVREVEILQQVVLGKTNADIGKEMFLSPFTIKTHIKNIYRKMHVNSRAEVTRVALRQKMV